MTDWASYTGLFLGAFLAATVIPGSSEAVLAGLLALKRGDAVALLVIATTANVLGSVVNWACGRFLARYQTHKWFPVSPVRYGQAIAWYNRYGLWSLLFAWVPIIGDPLTVAAGALRVPLGIFAIVVTIGKFARYLAIFLAFRP